MMGNEPRCSEKNERLLFFDVTRHSRQSHLSGLKRVSSRLFCALSELSQLSVVPVRWSSVRRSYLRVDSGKSVGVACQQDIFFSPEIFSLSERPFMRGWLRRFEGRTGRIFYDAIPFLYPQTTWPKSVRRFPKLLADLAAFDKVFYISGQSREDARQAGERLLIAVPDGSILMLGSDYREIPDEPVATGTVTFLNVGILEPRKGQHLLLDACEELWSRGYTFKLVLLGRVNPHFGRPLLNRIRELQARGRDLVHLAIADDDELAKWHRQASLLVSPSRAEGFGLPVLEALWAGCPVLASNQPACRLLPEGSGCLVMDAVERDELRRRLGNLLDNPNALDGLRQQVDPTSLPRWHDTARQLIEEFPVSS